MGVAHFIDLVIPTLLFSFILCIPCFQRIKTFGKRICCKILSPQSLTHSYLETCKRAKGKRCRPREDIVCLQYFPSKIELKRQNRPGNPKMTNGLVQSIKVEEFTSMRWVYVLVDGKITVKVNAKGISSGSKTFIIERKNKLAVIVRGPTSLASLNNVHVVLSV